jgi:hypothetical protein
MLLTLAELEELLDWNGAEREEDDSNFELVMIVDERPGALLTALGLVEPADTEDILGAGTNDFAVELRLLLIIGAELELLGPVKLLELSDWYGVGYDDGYGDKSLLELSDLDGTGNDDESSGTKLIICGVKLELPERPTGLDNIRYNGVEDK